MIRGFLLCSVLAFGAPWPGQDSVPSAESAPSTREAELPKVDVAGKVLGPDGSPISGARVHWFWPWEGGRSTPEEALTTDDRGSFRGTLTIWLDDFALVAYSSDGRLAGLIERKKGATGDVVIKLGPAVRVKARVASDPEGRKPVAWFNSTWRVCRLERSQHMFDFLGRRRSDRVDVAMASAEGGDLDLRLPAGSIRGAAVAPCFAGRRTGNRRLASRSA